MESRSVLLDAAVRALPRQASEKILLRALDLVERGRVECVSGAGEGAEPARLRGRVRGAGVEPYRVTIRLGEGAAEFECDCPFDWEPVCKHGAALLLREVGAEVRAALLTTLARGAGGGAGEGDDARRDAVGDAPGVAAAVVDSGADPGGGAGFRPLHPERSYLQLREREIAVRVARGREGEYEIERLQGGLVYGRFRVRGVEGAGRTAYEVQIRDILLPVNRCSCPDYGANMLGTCKHIEAVLQRAREIAGPRFDKLARKGPGVGRVVVRRDDHPRIALLPAVHPTPAARAVATQFFDEGGVLLGDPRRALPELIAQVRYVADLVVDEDVLEWVQQLLKDDRARARRAEVRKQARGWRGRPPGFPCELTPRQVEGALFLAERGRALLADAAGAGKPRQALAAAWELRRRGEVSRCLVTCAESSLERWRREIEAVTGEAARPLAIGAGAGERGGGWLALSSHEELAAGVATEGGGGATAGWPAVELLIVADAQALGGWESSRARRIKSLPVPFLFLLQDGAPEADPEALYSLLQWIDARVLGPLWAFNERFGVAGAGEGRGALRNAAELQRRIRPVVLRRTGADEGVPDAGRMVETEPVAEAADADADAAGEAPVTLPAAGADSGVAAAGRALAAGEIEKMLQQLRVALDAAVEAGAAGDVGERVEIAALRALLAVGVEATRAEAGGDSRGAAALGIIGAQPSRRFWRALLERVSRSIERLQATGQGGRGESGGRKPAPPDSGLI